MYRHYLGQPQAPREVEKEGEDPCMPAELLLFQHLSRSSQHTIHELEYLAVINSNYYQYCIVRWRRTSLTPWRI